MRGTTNNKLKDGDSIIFEEPSTNKSTALIFTNLGNCYKLYLYQLDDVKPSTMGLYLPQELKLEDNESIIGIINVGENYEGNIIEVFENGNIAKTPVKSFETANMRSQLKNAICIKSPLVKMFKLNTNEGTDIILQSSINKILISNTSLIPAKDSKSSQGNNIMKPKKDSKVIFAETLDNIDISKIENVDYYKNNGRGVGTFLKKNDEILRVSKEENK
jgi:DNA gyrase/topoisomerase IV subunit A